MHSIWHKFKRYHKIKHKHHIVHFYSIQHQSPEVLHQFHIHNQTNILQIQHFLDLYNLGKIHSICVKHDSDVIQASVFWNTHNSTFKLISHKLNNKTHVRIPQSNVIVHY